MPQSYDPKLGVLSAFEGVGTAISDIGKMGMMDTMETRRSKMEQDLKLQLQGKKQEFDIDQAGVEDVRKVKAATVKHGRDVELAGIKADTKASGRGKDSDKYELVTATGTPLKYDDVRKAWSNDVGANLETFDPDAAISFENYLKERDIRYRTDASPAPPKPLDEATYRQRVKESWKAQYGEDIEDSALDEMVNKNRAAGKITGAVISPAAEPGIMDAMAADTGAAQPNKLSEADFNALKQRADAGDREASIALYDAQQGYGEFAGGAPQGQPGALEEVEKTVAPRVSEYEKMGQVMEAERSASVQRKTIQDRLLKHRAKAVKSSARQVGRSAAKKETEKVKKTAKQVESALKKGNIKQVSKDSLKIALNNQSFVDGLSDKELQTLLDYLEQ